MRTTKERDPKQKRENEKLNKNNLQKESKRRAMRCERRLASENGDLAMHATQEVIIQIQVLDETPKRVRTGGMGHVYKCVSYEIFI